MKASIGLRTQSRSLTSGIGGRRIGCSDHQSGPARPFSGRRLEGGAFPRRAGVDPAAQQLDLGVRERSVRRHFAVVDLGVEQAVGRLAGDDHGAGLAALEQPGARGQVEVAAELDGVVALEAVRLQQRGDVLLERRGGVPAPKTRKADSKAGVMGVARPFRRQAMDAV